MPRNIYIVNKNRRPAQGGGPPGDFGKSVAGGITPAGTLSTQLFAPPPPQNFSRSMAGVIVPSGVLTRTLIVPSPGGNRPHEPPGMTRMMETQFNALPGQGGGEFIYPGGSASISGAQGPGTGWEIVQDPTAPQGSSCYQYRWPTGLGNNGSGRQFNYHWRTPFPNGLKHIYWAYWVRIPQSDFETNAVFKPFGYLNYGDSSQNNQFFPMQYGKNAAGTSQQAGISTGPWSMNLEMRDSATSINQPHFGTVNPWIAGPWCLWEWEVRLNDIGSANGFLKAWCTRLGGSTQQFANLSGQTYLPCEVPSDGPLVGTKGFLGVHHDPIWGGSVTSYGTKKRTDHQWYSWMYFSANLALG